VDLEQEARILEREISELQRALRKAQLRERNFRRTAATPGEPPPHRIGCSPVELEARISQVSAALREVREEQQATARALQEVTADLAARGPYNIQLGNAVADYSAAALRNLLQKVVDRFVTLDDLPHLLRGALQHRHATTLARFPLTDPSTPADYFLAGCPSIANLVWDFFTVPEPEDSGLFLTPTPNPYFPIIGPRKKDRQDQQRLAPADTDRRNFQSVIRELHRVRRCREASLQRSRYHSWLPLLRLHAPALEDFLLGHPRWEIWGWRVSPDNEGTAGEGDGTEGEEVEEGKGGATEEEEKKKEKEEKEQRNWRVGYALSIVLEGEVEINIRLTAIREGADSRPASPSSPPSAELRDASPSRPQRSSSAPPLLFLRSSP
jgi:hypothetical protein